jgi:hypothetical protein
MNPAAQNLSRNNGDLSRRVAAAEAALAPVEEKSAAARAAANQAVLPGPLREAFLPQTLHAAGLALRAVVPSDYGILEALDSPLLEIIRGKTESDLRWTTDQIWELVFLWTRPVAEARAALTLKPQDFAASRTLAAADRAEFRAHAARKNFHETALAATADQLPAGALLQSAEIGLALGENFKRSFGPALAYEPPAAEDGSVFTAPPAEPAMASAGG